VEREEREKQIETFKRQIEELNASIAQCQEQLPAAGVPITRQVSYH
jgi:prefoldin subunit 5